MPSPDEEELDAFTDAVADLRRQFSAMQRTLALVLKELEQEGFGSFDLDDDDD